jgi:hypothetical protein
MYSVPSIRKTKSVQRWVTIEEHTSNIRIKHNALVLCFEVDG